MARQTGSSEDHAVRLLRVGERVRHLMSEILTRQQVHDDVLTARTVSITEVRMSPDLRQAKIFVKPLLGDEEEVVLQALRRNTAFFQREVAKQLGLKFAPKLKFQGDESFDEASRIDRLLADPRVARDLDEPEE